MNSQLRPEERLKRLESGIHEILIAMSESRHAFGSTEIKNERKALNARLNHRDGTMSEKARIVMLMDKLWDTAIVLNAVLKQRRSRKLLAAKEQAEALLKEFFGENAFDKQSEGDEGLRINDKIEKMFRTMSRKISVGPKSRPG